MLAHIFVITGTERELSTAVHHKTDRADMRLIAFTSGQIEHLGILQKIQSFFHDLDSSKL
ncbi:hypothetical protein KL86DES1_10626 [uncultured Desulfovibrio sp.]|uniref:Uncharacterized protein n=1 Tax=uncultured Desulfovibrio sp. TaxID=167968 RepID=A0A212L065_9BACT|nr:hypothetical protein KL86DES1_10626 [uncultured Desulfovibrio sp.]